MTPSGPASTWQDEQEIMRTGRIIVDKEEDQIWPDGNVTWLLTEQGAAVRPGRRDHRHVRHLARHHAPQGGGVAVAGGHGGSGGGQPGQERFPGQHEPRNPHAHERHHRHDRTGAGHAADRRAARLPEDGPRFGRIAADGDQRHPRFLQDRGRQAGTGADDVRPPRSPGRHHEVAGVARPRQGAGTGLPHSPGGARSGWSATPAACGRSSSIWSATPSSSPTRARCC